MISTEELYWNERYNNEERLASLYSEIICELALRPSVIYKPKICIDGNKWCALYGEDIQSGVAGFGDSPEEAYADFDREWREKTGDQKK